MVPNPKGTLMPGMYVQALLPTGLAPEALLVPQQAVTRDLTGKPSVLVVKEGDVVEKRPISIDRAVGNQWLLQGGLAAGERVVTEGFQRVKPGDKVRAVEVDPKAPAKGRKGATGADAPPAAGAAPASAPAPAASR